LNNAPKSPENNLASESKEPRATTVKYPKPKILLLDLPGTTYKALTQKGFKVSIGTLGKIYKVPKSSDYRPIILKTHLPNFSEQEILLVDLAQPDFQEHPEGEKLGPDDEPGFWGKCDRGFIDPRVVTAIQVRKAFDRILSNGGAFVIFADAKTETEVRFAHRDYAPRLKDDEPITDDEWHLLSELSDMRVNRDVGEEMHLSENESALARLIGEHLKDAHFYCTLEGGYRYEDPWKTLAKNKFGTAIALCRCRCKNGTVIVLPQIADKTTFITKLFTDVLPELAPHLFPDIEKGKWTHCPEYELERVVELKKAEEVIEQNAKAEIAALEIELAKARAADGWIHDLLTGTDKELVDAVKTALKLLGFVNVVDVDEERDRDGKSRREDIQIQDQSPLLILDVKGLGTCPSDDDALQADKHAAIRMRELKRTDIIALCIVNHQRHMPPLERENAMPFRKELLDAAEELTLGLMTAWDLYRLVRNCTKFAWPKEKVKPLFYQKGRIEIVPKHFQSIGIIAKAWTDKFGVVIEQAEVRVGDQIAVEFPIMFEEMTVDSIHVNDQAVEHAKTGEPAGLLWTPGKPKLRQGQRVFRLLREPR